MVLTHPSAEFAPVFFRRLYQIARQEEERDNKAEDMAITSVRRGTDVGMEERNLLLAIGNALNIPRPNELLDSFEASEADMVESFLEKRGPHYNHAMQFLRIYDLTRRHMEASLLPERDVLERLVHYYGAFFGILRTGRISTADHINQIAFVEAGRPLPKEATQVRVLDDVIDFLLTSYKQNNHAIGIQEPVSLPEPTNAHPEWKRMVLGYAAKFFYTSAKGGSTRTGIGAISLPYFLYVTTGVDPEFAGFVIKTAVEGDQRYKVPGVVRHDLHIAEVIKDTITGKPHNQSPVELDNLVRHARVYREALVDGELHLDEQEILREFLYCVEGIRHPIALSLLLQATPVKNPYVQTTPASSQRTGSPVVLINSFDPSKTRGVDAVISSTPSMPPTISRGEMDAPSRRNELPLNILLNYYVGQ